MATILLVIHVIICLALIVSVLLQRSEGGALGIGGGGMTSGRSSANLMTKTTATLAGAFFLTSIALTILARTSSTSTESKIDSIKIEQRQNTGETPNKVIDAITPVPETKTEGPVVPTPK